jgi:hypothetical protein
MKESEYFGRDNDPAPAPIDQYFATKYVKFYAGMLKLHKVVLFHNYNLMFVNEALILREYARYRFILSNKNSPPNLIHIDGLPICTSKAYWATNAAVQYVRFPRTDLADRR